ncbi:MAG: hypothetical protein D6743_05970 [Calditrichaeota bacterium]|nr:MAG: hypothetical protein D6743_05970 [Calditrichota bacterium]
MLDRTISHYHILEELGAGGMGTVYKARDTKLDRFVALKFLPPHLSRDEEGKERFIREARAASSLNHPNIATIYEIEEADGQMFIAMEYIEGKSLRDLMRKGEGTSPLPLDDVLNYAGQIAAGLAKAHGKGIVHRDIKPSNVMVSEDGVVKIVDFGLAKLAGRTKVTRTGTTLGTVAYMSPEQARGEEVDHRTDIWSLGVTVYEMLSGRLPFGGEYDQAVLYSIVHEEPESVSSVRPGLPREVDEVVARALAKEPRLRYPSTQEFLQHLSTLRGAPPSLQPERKASVGRPRFRLTTVAWAAGVAILLVVAALFLLQRPVRPPAAPPRHTQVTFLGDATLPALSPDGKFTAFTRGTVGGTGARSVYVQEIGGSRAIEVFHVDGGRIRDIAWSPDGSELLIEVDDDGVYLVPRLGGPARRFAVQGRLVVWSPDGKRFATRTARATFTVVDKATGGTRVVAWDSTHFPALNVPMPPIGMDWSPAGDWIVFGHWEKSRVVLWTVNINTGELNRLVEGPEYIWSPRWSPQGNAVYYLREGEGQTPELWKITVDPGSGKAKGAPRFLSGGISMGFFSLARDGKRLLYTRGTGLSNLWVIKREGSGKTAKFIPHQITQGTVSDMLPAVSPDGDRVAFTRSVGEAPHIFVVPIEGGERRQLTFSDWQFNPAWSPDGQRLAFITERNDTIRIGIVNADGSGAHILPQPRPTNFVTWAPGPRILYHFAGEGGRRIHLLDPESGEVTQFPKEKPWPRRLGFLSFLSPDGRRVAFHSIDPDSKLSLNVGDIDSGEWHTVLQNRGHSIGWSADGSALYVLDDGSNRNGGVPPRVLRIPAEGGEPVVVVALPFSADEVWGCAPNSDGSAFVCSISKTQRDLWLLENYDPER